MNTEPRGNRKKRNDQLDKKKVKIPLVEPEPYCGLGKSINEFLRKKDLSNGNPLAAETRTKTVQDYGQLDKKEVKIPLISTQCINDKNDSGLPKN